ncbi:TnpV protein [Mediterraneibacter glycyrrhizinilyticus]|uniref:TnpV protein n=1 Tax=Mediterraneibacter glycyrrhizinilyticus TaxID=342942 RepID=UPI0025A470E3|nr:TnpV protein [Mediterraneibacter glycyrrhizinilyticus]MDM8210761.1 TnpV protein [Mediterraneibacter glycyrrhizinilyticus]
MEQYIYNEQNGLWYELRGDYYIPCLKLPAEKEERSIGVWGQRHLRYIREHKKALYTSLLTSGKLQSYLADVEEQAQELFHRLMKQRAEREGITETLKADNQMEWVQRMNALRSAVIETVNAEVIFV